MSERRRYEEQVKGPGKFEGCEPWVPYLYEADGGPDDTLADQETDGHWAGLYVVNDDDVFLFPGLVCGTDMVVVEQSDGGCRGMTLDEYATWVGKTVDEVIGGTGGGQ